MSDRHPITFAPRSQRPGAAARVLLIDDDEDCRALARDALLAGPFDDGTVRVSEFSTGTAAVAALTAEATQFDAPPNLIYLDMEMPGLHGLETLTRLRQCASLCDVPIVMLTGCADHDLMRLAARLGANSYLVKPVASEDYLTLVEHSALYWLRLHQSPARAMVA